MCVASVRAFVPRTLASDRSQVVSLSKNQPGEYRQPVKCELCPAAGDCKARLITGSAARLHPHSETFKFTKPAQRCSAAPEPGWYWKWTICVREKMSRLVLLSFLSNLLQKYKVTVVHKCKNSRQCWEIHFDTHFQAVILYDPETVLL